MGTSDGTVVGPTRILNNGPDSDRFNIVFLAEGFKTPSKQLLITLVTTLSMQYSLSPGLTR
jgi:hypothetical protein